MVGVGVVPFVGNVFDGAEPFLVNPGKPVAEGFRRSPVQGKAQASLGFPVIAGLAQPFHHPHGEFFPFGGGVAAALHGLGAFVQADVSQAQGGIAAFQQLVDGFPFLQAGNGAVLPVDGAHIAADALQGIVPDHQGFIAQIQPFIQQLPEFCFVPFGNDPDLRQVQGHNSLVKPAFKLVIAFFVLPGRQEGTAAHGREYIPLVDLPHFLGGDVVRIHPFDGALDRQFGQIVVLAALQAVEFIQHIDQFGEGRGHVDTHFVLDAFQPLPEDFRNDLGIFLNVFIMGIQVQEQGHERRLSVGGHQGIDLVLDGLDPAGQFILHPAVQDGFHFIFRQLAMSGFDQALAEFFPAPAQVFAQVGYIHGLAAILGRSHGSDDLGHDGTSHLEALGAFDQLAVHHRAVVQHIPQVHQAAVEHGLDEVIRIVEMDDTLIMGPGNLFRQHHPAGQVTGHFPGNQVTLGGHHDGVLVGVFLHDILVLVADQAQDGFIGGVGLPDQGPVVAVDDVGLGQFIMPPDHDLFFHHVLDVFHQQSLFVLVFHKGSNLFDVFLSQPFLSFHCLVGFGYGSDDFIPVKRNRGSVPFDNLHGRSPLYIFLIILRF